MQEAMVECGKLFDKIYGDPAVTALTSISHLRDVSAVHHHGWNNGLSCVQSTPPIHDDKSVDRTRLKQYITLKTRTRR